MALYKPWASSLSQLSMGVHCNRIYDLILQIWNEERIPSSWAEALICPIQKKGDVQNCENSTGN
jgi:hypothetical protein